MASTVTLVIGRYSRPLLIGPRGLCLNTACNATVKTFTVQCADVNTRAPHPLHCSQLPSQLMYLISLSATRGAPLGYFLFKLLSFLLLRPIFKVAATYDSERDPLTSATRHRRNPAKRSPDFYVHQFPVVETHGRPFYHALHFRTHLRPNWLRSDHSS